MKLMRIILGICLLVLPAFGQGQKEQPLPKDLPSYGPQPRLRVPEVKVSKLENGLTLWLVPQPGLPKVAVAVAIRGGMAADPKDRPGLSELLANTVNQGTKSRNARQIAEELQGAGGDYQANADRDGVTVATSVLSEKADVALAILADLLENASFPESEVALAKRNLADSLKQREARPGFLANRALAKAMFGDHPYSIVAPTQEAVAKTTATELRQEYSRRFRPDQALFVAVGDFDASKMEALVRENLGSWTLPATAQVAEIAAPQSAGPHAVFLVPRPGSVQTTLALGAFGPLQRSTDYESAEVANAIYGGTFSSRLVSNIREDKGYTYSPGAFLETFRQAGVLRTQADVRNAVTAPSFNEIVYELNRMVTTSPTEEELTKAKHSLLGIQAIVLQLRSAVAGQLAHNWIQGLPPDQISRQGQDIEKVNAANVDSATRKYFPAASMTVVAIGEEKVIREAFAPFGIPIQPAP